MRDNSQETSYPLARRELMAVEQASGYLLVCRNGELWITQQGSSQDIVLEPGQSWQVESPATVVISAFRPSLLLVVHPPLAAPRPVSLVLAQAVLALVRRWRYPSLASHPATQVR